MQKVECFWRLFWQSCLQGIFYSSTLNFKSSSIQLRLSYNSEFTLYSGLVPFFGFRIVKLEIMHVYHYSALYHASYPFRLRWTMVKITRKLKTLYKRIRIMWKVSDCHNAVNSSVTEIRNEKLLWKVFNR